MKIAVVHRPIAADVIKHACDIVCHAGVPLVIHSTVLTALSVFGHYYFLFPSKSPRGKGQRT